MEAIHEQYPNLQETDLKGWPLPDDTTDDTTTVDATSTEAGAAAATPHTSRFEGPCYRGFQNTDYELKEAAEPFQNMPRHALSVTAGDLLDFNNRSGKICRILGGLSAKNLTALLGLNTAADDLKSGVHLPDGDKPFASLNDFFEIFRDDTWIQKMLVEDHYEGNIRKPTLGSTSDWKKDEYFALQFIAGLNPVMLSKVKQVDDVRKALCLCEDDVQRVTPSGTTLEQLVQEERLFLVDYAAASNLNGVVMQEYHDIGKELSPPLVGRRAAVHSPAVLLWATGDKQLMPLAIQINSGNSVTEEQVHTWKHSEDADQRREYDYFMAPFDNPGLPHIFHQPRLLLPCHDTSRSDYWQWLYAKMCVCNTDALIHEAISHLGFTHLAMETVVVGVQHCIPPTHALWELLEPHLFGTVAINTAARLTLINMSKGNFFTRNTSVGAPEVHRAVNLFYPGWRMDETAVPVALAKRGFGPDDKETLEHHYYKKDTLRVWEALKTFVHGVLKDMYGEGAVGDAKVQADTHLNFMFDYLSQDVVDGRMGGNMKGLPKFNQGIDELEEFLTIFLYTVTAQHSAVNFGQFAFLAFAPNRPLFLGLPFPEDGTLLDESYIVNSMANKPQAVCNVLVSRVLSLPAQHPIMKDASPALFEIADRVTDSVTAVLARWGWKAINAIVPGVTNTLEHAVPTLMASWKATATQVERKWQKKLSDERARLKEDLSEMEHDIIARKDTWEAMFPTFPPYTWLLPSDIASSISI